MVEYEHKRGFGYMVKDGLRFAFKLASASIFPSIIEGTESIMNIIEKRIAQVEKRIIRNISSLLVIILGGIFLIFSFFFFLVEYLSWSKTASFFSLGVLIILAGLLYKLLHNDD